ncbi:hypothetical protein B4096_2628 [Heyndrickxia coagulans]|uniref:Uncharacterized protein n=1 Tax=Heyndrickxia coagulans TaxID=1398 RepID=A0A150KA73_HEYCO|nr:hypothetical protein B4100_3242 [Heyndrickxia coagulans]KYC66271.1 hypothetical protein B4099_3030 [Heyndrickxia coagulans]KYC91673.1 hypothetical protein B4096_2628 [Heyndrickxia coagulans]
MIFKRSEPIPKECVRFLFVHPAPPDPFHCTCRNERLYWAGSLQLKRV